MDFVSALPRTQSSNEVIWVIVDRLTKSAHFIPLRIGYTIEIYMQQIVRLHVVPLSIVSDRDPRFVSLFWKSLHQALVTRLHFSTAYRPQTDG